MKTKNKNRINLRSVSPDYPRIPHVDKVISNMTHDDILTDSDITFPIEAWVQEKVDGANMGVSWINGPIIRNRNNILKKGYIGSETPAKLQFRPAWNWVHSHEDDIVEISEKLMSPITIYGEWMLAKHSLEYDKLPDWFLAYDIYLAEERRFVSPDVFEELISETNIEYIKPQKMTFNSMDDIVECSERESDYRSGKREGIVIKSSDGKSVTDFYKVVNKHFTRTEDFNKELIKNKIGG